jgi:hypothetical protein
LYLGVKSDASVDKVVLQLQASGDRSSQIWIIDSNGYLVNRAHPSKVVCTTSPWFYSNLNLIEKSQQQNAVKWDVKSLYEGFIVSTSGSFKDYVLAPPNGWFNKVTVDTQCILQAQNNNNKNQLWSLQLAHEQK